MDCDVSPVAMFVFQVFVRDAEICFDHLLPTSDINSPLQQRVLLLFVMYLMEWNPFNLGPAHHISGPHFLWASDNQQGRNMWGSEAKHESKGWKAGGGCQGEKRSQSERLDQIEGRTQERGCWGWSAGLKSVYSLVGYFLAQESMEKMVLEYQQRSHQSFIPLPFPPEQNDRLNQYQKYYLQKSIDD